ncbi:Type 4 prepilin-like proteins leader peptide-processing enzyme [compost metagenome]
MTFLLIALAFGLVLGSFGNSVVYRLPRRMRSQWRQAAQAELGLPVDAEPPQLTARRSHCPACAKQIAWYDNIPVVSWLVLRGRCRHCGSRISPRYLALELTGGVLGVASVAWFGFTWQAAAAGVAGLLLLWSAAIDAEHQLLPDALMAPLLALGLLSSTQDWFSTPRMAILGAALGWAVAAFPAWVFHRVRGVHGLGGGDMFLVAALGAFLGPVGVLYTQLGAGVLATLALCLKSIGKGRAVWTEAAAFGPWLCLAGVTVFVLQQARLLG